MTDNFNYPTLFSNCCGEHDRGYVMGADQFYSDMGICPRCKDHCLFVTAAELESIDNNPHFEVTQ